MSVTYICFERFKEKWSDFHKRVEPALDIVNEHIYTDFHDLTTHLMEGQDDGRTFRVMKIETLESGEIVGTDYTENTRTWLFGIWSNKCEMDGFIHPLIEEDKCFDRFVAEANASAREHAAHIKSETFGWEQM